MSTFKSDFLAILESRGFIHQCSNPNAIDSLAAQGNLIAYVGYDCTAPSLHIGNLTTLMMLYWLQQTGNKPVVLLGGATTMIGDPSGKDETRKFLAPQQIIDNKETIGTVFPKFLHFGSGPLDALLLDNTDWLSNLKYIDLLRNIGMHFSVNRMLTMDSVRLRLERQQEMSFIEFNYMILQSYDFVHLAKTTGCNLQIGGSDQWGNIITGTDLGRRMHALQLHALTTPLVMTSSGNKMGKTAQGAVWLDAKTYTPYEYWQYWRNIEDADIDRFARLFTILPLDEIARMQALGGTEINEAKKILATEATALLHGREAAEIAAETSRYTFEDIALSENLPSINITHQDLHQGIGLLTVLVKCGLAKTNGEARRLVKGRGVKLNDSLIEDEQRILGKDDIITHNSIKLSLGRKRHFLIKIR